MRNALRTIALLAGTSSLCWAHVGDRVVPIFEIPEESLSEIDIHDGVIGDWLDVIGEPSLTGPDLTPDFGVGFGEEYNPGDLDFRIWLAWHRGLNRVYIALEGVDDVFVDLGDGFSDGHIGLEIDGDHSGGIFTSFVKEEEGFISMWQSVQQFNGGPLSYQREPAISMLSPVPDEECCWFSEPPYADVGGAIYGEQPSVWMTEMYVTPFDRLVPDSRDETVISELRPEGIIGLRVFVPDLDDPQESSYDALFTIPPIDRDFDQGPDQFGDGLLVPVGGSAGSAVESVTWGRIKASLQP